MARRKKRFFALKLNQKSTRSILALAFFFLAIATLFSYLGQAAQVSNFLQDFLNRTFGFGSILIPFLLFLAGLTLTQIRWEVAQPRVLFGSLLAFISFMALTALFAENSSRVGSFFFFLASGLARAVSPFLAFLLLGSFFLIAGLVTFNTSLTESLNFLQQIAQPLRRLIQQKAIEPLIESRRKEQIKLETKEAQEVSGATHEPSFAIHAPTGRQSSARDEDEVEIIEETRTLPGLSADRSKASAVGKAASVSAVSKPQKPYQPPPLSLLSDPEEIAADRGDIQKNAALIEKTLESFGIQARVAEVNLGPSVTQYALDLAEGTKISKITGLSGDLALALAAPTGNVRIEAPIPGKSLVGIEVPNYSPTLVTLKSVLTSEKMTAMKSRLAVALGHNVAGEPIVADIARWPHVLLAGATGSGKSVLLHSMINSILFRATPDEVRFIMVDPKRVELTAYAEIPHLLTPVMVDTEKTVRVLRWAVSEMENRYRLFAQVKARNIADFNEKHSSPNNNRPTILPYILIVVDELADLMAFSPADVENTITRIAQMSRATGIHLVLSTQRPSVDVLTGLIKANIPTRIALNVTSGTDSRVIIDTVGAEKLLGKGDMLYLPSDAAKPIRIQGVYVSDPELHRLIDHLRQFAPSEETAAEAPADSSAPMDPAKRVSVFDLDEKSTGAAPQPEDNLFDDAVRVIVNNERASASLLQRRLKIGYARAARILDTMEQMEMISAQEGSHPREVNLQVVQKYLNQRKQQSPSSDPNLSDLF